MAVFRFQIGAIKRPLGEALQTAISASFDSKLVRLKALSEWAVQETRLSFDSKLVRLKGVGANINIYRRQLFRFQIGAIKSSYLLWFG